MSVYYDPTGGDKDARDFVTLRRDERRRKGLTDTHRDEEIHTGVGMFEKHTKVSWFLLSQSLGFLLGKQRACK